MTQDLPLSLISAIVKSETKSAKVLGNQIVRAMEAGGADIKALEAEARAKYISDLEQTIERCTKNERKLRRKVEAGEIPEDKLARATERLLRAPANLAEHEKRLERALQARPIFPTSPTPERKKQSATQIRKIEIHKDQPVAHKFEWPIDVLFNSLTAEEREAAVALKQAYLESHPKSRVASWDGIPPGMMAPPSGLPVTDKHIHAAALRDALFYSLPYALQPIARNFILEESAQGHNRPLTRVEFGRQFIGCKDKAKASGAADAAIKATCAVLAQGLKDYAYLMSQENKKQVQHSGNVIPLRRG